jgi:hypothetical protein
MIFNRNHLFVTALGDLIFYQISHVIEVAQDNACQMLKDRNFRIPCANASFSFFDSCLNEIVGCLAPWDGAKPRASPN